MRTLLLSIVVVAAAAWWKAGATGVSAPLPISPPAPVLIGAHSCAAAACHNAGAANPAAVAGSEYSLALARDFTGPRPRAKDPHSDAYAALFSERSRVIVRRWKRLPDEAVVAPERELLCLRCHVHPRVDEALAAGRTSTFRIEDGVSCEACHGPAEHWLAEHFRPAWKKRSAAERAALGMTDLRSPVVRAATCIPCHVGHPGAEVDHDLIAAGHPWLRFDVLAHHGRLHKHWNSAQDALARGGADFARNMRWAGDLAAAEAALRLIARRAEAAPAVWPEFAYQDCRSCHHELSPDGPKPRRNLERLGGPRMNLAQFGPLLSGADHPSAPLDAAQLPLLLGPLQQSLAVWRPERAAVAAHARKAADWLAERRAQASH